MKKLTKNQIKKIEHYFKTKEMFMNEYGYLDCCMECQYCHFKNGCIVGGVGSTKKEIQNMNDQIKDIMPELYL